MEKKFVTIKNLILLIASALTLVAVSFAWFSLAQKNQVKKFDTDIVGSTIAVKYYESTNNGWSYKVLPGDINLNNMTDGSRKFYRMDVTTFDTPIKLIMSFDNLGSSNQFAKYVYFDYELVCEDTNQSLSKQTGLKMSDYTYTSVFAHDLSALQAANHKKYSVYYQVYLVTGSESLSGSGSLGDVKLLGQQVG